MNTKQLLLYLLLVSVVLFFVGYVLDNSYDFGLCVGDFEMHTYDTTCINFYSDIGSPLMYGFGALAVVFLALMVFPQSFNAWKKFAIWFIPIAAILFIIWPEPKGGIGVVPSVIGPGPEQMFQWISAFYILVSFGIIAVKQFRK